MKLMRGLIAVLLVLPGVMSLAQEGADLLFDMETLRHKPTEVTGKDKQKHPAGTVELVAGKVGKAVQFTFIDGTSGGFMVAPVRTSERWDKAQGISFWVKGDGSASWGGIEMIDKSDFKLRYGYCFPIDSTDWKKITVPWSDFIPELAAPPVDPGATDPRLGYKPSNFGNFWFGKWFYWREYPAHSYAIDEVVLESKIDVPALPPASPGLQRVKAKLKAKQPITIVTMGDSLTDTRHWANRKIVWCDLLAKEIESKHGSKVKIVNPAIGGTTLSQNLILMPRWVKGTPSPDLVTVFFGGNDWDSNVRGERFAQYLTLAIERIRRQTGGSADILLMTTAPGHARWETCKELEEAARKVAAQQKVGVVDIAGEFRKAGSADEALKQKYWEWDKVHLGAGGHELVKNAVLGAME